MSDAWVRTILSEISSHFVSSRKGVRKLLDKLDPEMAARWHWKDSRKVLRNLEIMVETGQKASEVIKKQDAKPLDSR